MKIMIFTSSPNNDGLTAACGNAAYEGALSGGHEAKVVSLNQLHIDKCSACGNGWGTCRNENSCQVIDDYQSLHEELKDYDGFVFITPVYWGEMSESVKAFTDRLRRCEAIKQENFYVKDKPFICVAAAGGSGNGCITCLSSMERFVDHVKGVKNDLITVTQKNRIYKLAAIYEAAKNM